MRPDRNSYTTLDFKEWEAAGGLVLTPKFQRRRVWTAPKRSFLIDTMLRELPIPPIYLRIQQDPTRSRTIREVIDGQQRLAAVLDYVRGGYSLSKSLGSPLAGRKYARLDQDDQDRILNYSFNCESFLAIGDEQVLEMFARMNTYSVKLNAQELRNGTWFGQFKNTVYELAREHLEFWRRYRIFSDQAIARMQEAEFVSEVLVAQIDGMQDKKGSLDDYYEEYDESYPSRARDVPQFRRVLDEIAESLGEDLQGLQWRRAPLFYTLYCVVYHRLFGMPKATPARVGKHANSLSQRDRERLREAALDLSDVLVRAREGELPTKFARFQKACSQQTDNIQPRTVRFSTLYSRAFG